jgi:ERCC4-type nuclease
MFFILAKIYLIMFDTLNDLLEETYHNPSVINSKKSKLYIDTQEGSMIRYVSKTLSTDYNRKNIWVEKMYPADYRIEAPDSSQEIIIERKSAKDFASSFRDGRLTTQVPELTHHYNAMIVIIGDIYDPALWRHTNFKVPDSVTRLLTGVTLRTDAEGGFVRIMQVPTKEQFVVLLDYIAKKLENEGIIRMESNVIRKYNYATKTNYNDPRVKANVRLSLIAMIPKIGRKKAEKILDHFDWNMNKLVNAPIGEFLRIEGIGKTLAKRICTVFED